MSEERRNLVIVADDEEDPRDMLEQCLTDQGYTVRVVDHPTAITGLGDCIALVMDIRFGTERFLGFEYVVQKRQAGELPAHTLVVFITHWRIRAADLQRAGRHKVMYKPIEFTELRKLIAAEARA